MLPAQLCNFSLAAQENMGETNGPAVIAEIALRKVRLSMILVFSPMRFDSLQTATMIHPSRKFATVDRAIQVYAAESSGIECRQSQVHKGGSDEECPFGSGNYD